MSKFKCPLAPNARIASKYLISSVIAESVMFYRTEILNEGYANYRNFLKQKSFLSKKKESKPVHEFILALEKIERKSRLLRHFINQLTKIASGESGFSAGLLKVKVRPFEEIILEAFEKGQQVYENEYKGIKPTKQPVRFASLPELTDNEICELVLYVFPDKINSSTGC